MLLGRVVFPKIRETDATVVFEGGEIWVKYWVEKICWHTILDTESQYFDGDLDIANADFSFLPLRYNYFICGCAGDDSAATREVC